MSSKSVLVLGAAGYIGFAVAESFTRNGWKTYGLVRSQEKAKELQKHEIIPVVADASNTSLWEKFAEQCDVIVETLSDYVTYGITTLNFLKEFSKKHPQKTIINTSGIWICGETNGEIDETIPLNPVKHAEKRVAVEKAYSEFAIVIRPTLVYGRQASITGMWFQSFKEGSGKLISKEGNYCPMIHLDDLAEAYVKAAEKGNSVKGQIFVINGSNERISDIASALAKHTAFSGKVEYLQPTDPLSEALCLSQRFSSKKANSMLGWVAKHQSFEGQIGAQYDAWLAYSS